ncbi:MAG: septal ring lytic transglycosylase RlpA family protein [Parvularculaceae bacterium]
MKPFLSRFAVLYVAGSVGVVALLSACSTNRLPEAPKSVGAPVKANPHYKVGAPYKIDGRWYVPRVDPAYEEVGVASWYGDAFHGKLTANGEIFDKRRISAAHKTLPMPTVVEVENLENGRRLVVRVNDRGPFVGDRVIDLSHASADALGFTAQGTARVRVRYLAEANLADLAPLPGAGAPVFASAPGRRAVTATQAAEPLADPLAGLIAEATGGPTAPSQPSSFWVEVAEVEDLTELNEMRLYIPGEGAIALHTKASGGRTLQSLRLGPFISEAMAGASLSRALAAGFAKARIIRGAGQ